MPMLFEEQDPRALGNAAASKYVGSRKKGYETWLAEKLNGARDDPAESGTGRATQKKQKPATAAESN